MSLTVLAGDCRETLKTLPDKSVHCCVSSPPYWGLRDYGVANQIGLEDSVEKWIEQMVSVFMEVHRVTRDDGTLWLNVGDGYNVAKTKGKRYSATNNKSHRYAELASKDERRNVANLKSKDMIGMPWRVAFALQAAGWYLRSDIVWSKPNPMPESVTDRPTKSHEYIFLFSKQPRYFYDAEAIKEPSSPNSNARIAQSNFFNQKGGPKDYANGTNGNRSMRRTLENWARSNGVNPKAGKNEESGDRRKEGFNERWKIKQNPSFSAAVCNLVPSRNKRSVWTVTTSPFKGAHFATFPPELIRPCILVGTSAHGCCAACGAPYVRMVEKGDPDLAHQRACGGDVNGHYNGKATKDYAAAKAQDASATKARILAGMVEKKTVGWKSTCKCESDVVPCTVLDPFAGAFTTAFVAMQEGRRAIMCELNPDYVVMGQKRCENIPPKGVKKNQARTKREPRQAELI